MDKKLLKTEFAKDSKSMQITVEGEIIISDAQPDIKEIICENVKPAITFYSVSDGRISYKGALRASAIYVSKDSEEPVSAASTVINFEDIMNIDGIMKENCVRVSVCTDRYEFRKINERKVSVKAVLTIGVKIFVTSECSCITADENEDGMQYQVQSDIVRNHVSQDKTDFDIHETFSIPAVKPEAGEVLTEFYSVADVDTKAMRGGYRITGVLKVDMVYLTKDSASADSVHFEAPFEQTVDNDFVTEDMHAVSNVSVTGLKAGAFEDSGGENRIVDIDAVFNEVTDVFDDEKITFVKDAYSVKYPCTAETQEIIMPEFIGRNKARFNLKSSATQNNGADILQVIGAEGNISLEDVYAQNGSAAAEGVAEVTVLYIASDDSRPVYSLKAYIPFHQEIDVPGSQDGDLVTADVYVDSVSFNIMNSSEIEAAVNIVIDAEVMRLVEKRAVSGVEKNETASQKPMPAAVIYTVQKEDSLWDIAKKYGAVKEDIMALNSMETEDSLNDKNKILIMRRV